MIVGHNKLMPDSHFGLININFDNQIAKAYLIYMEKKALLDSLLKTISLLHTKILVIYYLIINGKIGKLFWHKSLMHVSVSGMRLS